MIFYNGSNYDYHFIIKELAKEFEREFNRVGQTNAEYKIFSVSITKEVKRIGENGEETTNTISYTLPSIDSARSMGSSLSNLVDNLAEGIHKIKCKYKYDKKCETCGIKYKDCECCHECTNVKDDLILCKCLCCNRN